MKNQLTKIAALPSGAGCLSALPAEVGEARKPEPAFRGVRGMTIYGVDLGHSPDQVVYRMFTADEIAKHFSVEVRK